MDTFPQTTTHTKNQFGTATFKADIISETYSSSMHKGIQEDLTLTIRNQFLSKDFNIHLSMFFKHAIHIFLKDRTITLSNLFGNY